MASFLNQIFKQKLVDSINDILQFVSAKIIEEYKLQGHEYTGALEDTMRGEITVLSDGVMGVIYINDYYKYLDKGITADRIPFNPGSGAKHSKFISALIDWFRGKVNLSEDEAKRASFATARKAKFSEGIPTRGSYAFSKNGKRLGMFSDTISRNEAAINNGVKLLFNAAMTSVLQEANSKIVGEINITL